MRRQGYGAVFALALLWFPAAGGADTNPVRQMGSAAPRAASPIAVSVAGKSASTGTGQEIDRSFSEQVEATRVRALRLGSLGVESAARWLLASATLGSAVERAGFAQRLAPGLPATHAAMARARQQAGDTGQAFEAAREALWAMKSNIEARFWLESSLWVIATAASIAGALFFLLLVGAGIFRGVAHDLTDFVVPAMPEFSRVALLASLVFFSFVLGESWAGVGLIFFVAAMAFGERRLRVAAVMAAVILLAGIFPVANEAGRNLVALGSDPVARAAYAVSLDMQDAQDLARLERASNEDPLAARALAVRARLRGEPAQAKRWYRALLERQSPDPAIFVNLANLHLESGETARAITLYRRALAFGPSATALFNLAQAHAMSFEVADFDRVMAEAQRLDPNRVEVFSKLGGEGFVVDMPISHEVLRSRMLASAEGEGFADAVRRRVAPGLLGSGAFLAFGLFAVCGAIASLARSRFEPSRQCRCCGSRICARCDGLEWDGHLCGLCQSRPHPSQASDGIARSRWRITEERGWLVRAGAWLVPGVGALRGDQPGCALVAVLLFFGALFTGIWRGGVIPDAGVVGAAGPMILGTIGLALGLLYAGSLLGIQRVSRRFES